MIGKLVLTLCSQSSLSAAPEGKPCRQSALFQLAEVKQSVVGGGAFFKQTQEQFSNSMKRYIPRVSDTGAVTMRWGGVQHSQYVLQTLEVRIIKRRRRAEIIQI